MEVDHLETVVEHTEPLEDSQGVEQIRKPAMNGMNHDELTSGLRPEIGLTQHNEQNDFNAKLALYQKELDNNFQAYKESLSYKERDADLEDLEWDELQTRYEQEMKTQIASEQDVMNEFSIRFQQFMLWMQVSNEKEAERAIKRLKTRIAFVQNSETQFAAKREHYQKVLAAFENAMALLGNL